jgi:hypothetical protein
MHVVERRGLGATEDEHRADGGRDVVWRDSRPGGIRYEWTLTRTGQQP